MNDPVEAVEPVGSGAGPAGEAASPTVSVVIPVYNEEEHIEATLASVFEQRYGGTIEVLVVDGRSTDRTRDLVAGDQRVRLLDNPRRLQSAALNVGLAEAGGDVVVRVDGHCRLEPDYVASCVETLERTGAAMVGGAMSPTGTTWVDKGIAAAMASPVGAGPARFHVGGSPGWVDTVYLGAYRIDDARAVGGYRDHMAVNEDAEFAIRMARRGGIWFDPSIRSSYTPRASFGALARQFFRYGRGRAETVRHHPRSLRPRQLASPLLLLGLLSPWRRLVASGYVMVVAVATAGAGRRDAAAAPGFALSLPVMHLAWASGFVVGLVRPESTAAESESTLELVSGDGGQPSGR